jgi:hypothetical protein
VSLRCTQRLPGNATEHPQGSDSLVAQRQYLLARCDSWNAVRHRRLVKRFGHSVTVREIGYRFSTRAFSRVGRLEKRARKRSYKRD